LELDQRAHDGRVLPNVAIWEVVAVVSDKIGVLPLPAGAAADGLLRLYSLPFAATAFTAALIVADARIPNPARALPSRRRSRPSRRTRPRRCGTAILPAAAAGKLQHADSWHAPQISGA